MWCFARNSALRAAPDPDTDDPLFDIVINGSTRGRNAAREAPTHCAAERRHLLLLPLRVWAHFGLE